MDYKIIENINSSELEAQVKNLSKNGWRPLGGVSVFENFERKMVYVQALINDFRK